MRIDAIKIEGRHRKDFRDLDSLAASIEELGVLQPVLVTADFRLIAGERRIRAANSLGMETIPARVVSHLSEAADLLKAERDENVCRQEMTVSEKVSLAKQIEELEKPAAAERQAEGQDAGRESRWDGSGSAEPEPKKERRAADLAGEAVGMSRITYQRAKYVMDTAEDQTEEPEVREVAQEAVKQMDEGTMAVRSAQRQVNEAAGRSELAITKKQSKPKGETDSRLTRPQPPKLGGNRKKHAAVIDSMVISLSAMATLADEITELDDSVTSEEAARLADDLSRSIRSLNRMKQNLNRKATR